MTPLYYANVASFINLTENMSNTEVEEVVEYNAQRFEDIKTCLIKKWDTEGKSPCKLEWSSK